ncbi:MAG TPA: rhomboid family intramembrane serine protease [Sandaracinaceae bacterium]
MLDKLERKLGRWAIPNLALLLVGGQAATYVLTLAKPEFALALALIPDAVLQGEVWRLVTFLFFPPSSSPLFVIFELYFLFLFGRALEEHWGEFRFNVFVLVGWALSAAASFAVPGAVATNVYLMGSLLFAFAYLNPGFTIMLFFVLPIRIKWIALLSGAVYAWAALTGDWSHRALIAAGVANFFLFFGRDMWLRVRGASRRRAKREVARRAESKARHECAVCGITDLEDSSMQFRYCSQCAGSRCYCMDHIRDHEHVRA